MIIIKHLVINSRRNVTIREKPPKLKGNEICLKLELDIPNAIFERPLLVARMNVPASAVPQVTIDTKITDNIEKIIKAQTGLSMVVSILEEEEREKYDK